MKMVSLTPCKCLNAYFQTLNSSFDYSGACVLLWTTEGCFFKRLFDLHDHDDGNFFHDHAKGPAVNPPRYLFGRPHNHDQDRGFVSLVTTPKFRSVFLLRTRDRRDQTGHGLNLRELPPKDRPKRRSQLQEPYRPSRNGKQGHFRI